MVAADDGCRPQFCERCRVTADLGTKQRRTVPEGPRQYRRPQRSAYHPDASEISLSQVRAGEVDVVQAHAAQDRAPQVGIPEVAAGQILIPEVNVGEILRCLDFGLAFHDRPGESAEQGDRVQLGGLRCGGTPQHVASPADGCGRAGQVGEEVDHQLRHLPAGEDRLGRAALGEFLRRRVGDQPFHDRLMHER